MNSPPTRRLRAFPRCRVLALVDDDDGLERTLTALAPHLDLGTVRVLSGQRGARALDVSGAQRGLRGRLARVLQDVAYDRSGLATHEAHLRRQGHLLLVPARGSQRAEVLAAVLAGQGAHGLVWFARFSVVDITPRRRAVTTPALLVGATRAALAPEPPVAAHAA